MLFALDSKGTVTGRVRLTGAKVEDWEAIALGPCPAGSCIYVGDIGDNEAERDRITVYRVPEPEDAIASATAEAIDASYPEGPHDAEALLVTPDGRLYVVTKGETGAVGLYRYPADLRPGVVAKLQIVGKARVAGKAGRRR